MTFAIIGCWPSVKHFIVSVHILHAISHFTAILASPLRQPPVPICLRLPWKPLHPRLYFSGGMNSTPFLFYTRSTLRAQTSAKATGSLMLLVSATIWCQLYACIIIYNLVSIYLYTETVTTQRNNKAVFHSVLLTMARDPAEFGWHCWSNTAHPPPFSTTYIASYLPLPLLPPPPGCLCKATPWQQQMPIRTVSQSFATHFYSQHTHLPLSHPSSYHSGLSLLHPSTQT